MIKKNISLIISFLICIVALTSCEPKSDVESVVKHQTEITTIVETTSPTFSAVPTTEVPTKTRETKPSVTNANKIQLDDIPPYYGKAHIEINGNSPFFTSDDYTTSSYEYYSDLDNLGRCGVASACVGGLITYRKTRSNRHGKTIRLAHSSL